MRNEPGQSVAASEGARAVVPGTGGAQQVLGDFEILREIGRGGMGTVYEARQISLQRVVALKVLAPHVASTPKAVARFRREAQAAAKLHHTHIVPIFAQGEAGGAYFYAMEFVDGESLNARIGALRAIHRPETPLDQAETLVLPRPGSSSSSRTQTMEGAKPSSSGEGSSAAVLTASGRVGFGTGELFHEVARHLAEVADALDYAHARGVVHRDIKPHNLLFGSDGRLRVSDFGLARLSEQPGVTITGEMLGSPLYMSPEQITGDPNVVDHRTDIYSLGATMYEWLALTPPYPGETRERVISRILTSEAKPLRSENPAVPVDLETICLKAIDRDLGRRYQTAGAMRDDLRRFLASRPILARRAGRPVRLARFLMRHQIATLMVGAVLLGGGLLWALLSKDRRVQLEQAETAKAKAEAVEATKAVVDAKSDSEILFAFMNAAIPGSGMVAEKVASGQVRGPGLPDISLKIATPSEIARLAVEEFFRSVVSPDWPSSIAGPGSEAATIQRAFDRWVAGNADEAEALLSEYLKSVPNDYEAVQMHAALCAVLGRFDAMREDADQLLKGGVNPYGYLWRGLANLLSNRIDPSLSDLTRAALGQDTMWVKLFRGLAILQANQEGDTRQNAEARKLFEEALKDLPSLIPARLGLARSMTAIPGEEDYAAALREADEVLKVDPKNVHALVIRGESRGGMMDYDAALRDFKEAISVAGYLPELLARSVAVMGARRSLEPAAEGEPGPPAEMKSRHGTEMEDGASAPVFNWLNPRRQVPRGESGTRGPSSMHGRSWRLPSFLP